ncbi:MAG: glycoside hydrolase family 127 protein, partial [Tannerella sp.]|nr:glycoside hydrolase family 127 protein [Tannerella sp.]
DKWNHIPYGDVKLSGEIGRRIDITINNNIKKLDLGTNFLGPFAAKQSNGGFIGVGMFLDAAVRFAAYSGDEELVSIKNRIISHLTGNQSDDGYIGYFVKEKRLWTAWDIHEMSYIITGLLSDYEFFGQKESLDAAVRAADYILSGWGGRPSSFSDFYLLGIDKVMVSLYKITGEERFSEFGQNKKPLTYAPGIVQGRTEQMTGHIFAHLAVNEAQLNMYRMTSDEQFTKPAHEVMSFLCNHDGLSVIGGAGQEETWTDDQDGEGDHAETCATAYMIRIYDNLLRLYGQSFYGDMMERSIHNALFAAQSPDGRKIRYYTPFEGERRYFDNDFYCCPNNYRRIVSELPLMIYYTKPEGGIAVNLYTESSAKTSFSDGVTVDIEQKTDYPNSGLVDITLKPSKQKSFPLILRIPRWAQNSTVKVNGVEVKGKVVAGEFFVIDRKWKSADRVTLDMPMKFRLVSGRKRQSGRVAIMKGPMVYCFSRAANPKVNNTAGVSNIGKITIDPASLKETADSASRKTGTACLTGAWKTGFSSNSGKYDYELKLTEFTDPDGIVTYFRLPAYTNLGVVDDELIIYK